MPRARVYLVSHSRKTKFLDHFVCLSLNVSELFTLPWIEIKKLLIAKWPDNLRNCLRVVNETNDLRHF